MSSKNQTPSGLPPCKRYIASHNSSGESIILSSPPHVYHGALARSYALASVPPSLSNDVDVTAYLSETGPTSFTRPDIVVPGGQGVNMVVFEFPPGGASGMHRTVSVDFSICVVGRIAMEVDGGERVELGPGDHVIQRGTMHKWINMSQTEPARAIGVTMACVPFEIPGTGKILAEEHVKGTGGQRKEAGSRL